MKIYNTICGIICILLLVAAMAFALYAEEPTEIDMTPVSLQEETPEPEPTIESEDTPQPETTAPEAKSVVSEAQPIEPIHEQPYIRYQLTESERAIVERVVMAESGNQHLNGQIAIAQCILNTAEAKGMRPDAVVLAPKQYAKPASAGSVSYSVKQAVSAVFDHGITVTDEPIRYFYAPKYCSGSWHESALTYVITIGDHKFFKAK